MNPLSLNNGKYKVNKSSIHGLGVFCSKPIEVGEIIDVVIKDEKIVTDLGKYVNHSWSPNTRLYKMNNRMYALKAIYDLEPNQELTADYNDTPDYICKADPLWT